MKPVFGNGIAAFALSALPFVATRSAEVELSVQHLPALERTEISMDRTQFPVDADQSVILNETGEEPSQDNALLLWGGIAGCLATSAALSGLTLGVFSVSRLRLALLAAQGDEAAKKVLALREDSNTTLATLIWGNVGINVGLTLLSDRALAGAAGMAFSIGALTILGEIIPQAYFSRHAVRTGAALEPLVKGLRCLLYPVAKPCGMILDRMVGQDAVDYFREQDLRELLKLHSQDSAGDISHIEATGSANFLALDDVCVAEEGERIDAASIIQVALRENQLDIPDFSAHRDDALLKRIQESGKKWVVFCQPDGTPRKVLDANAFLRDVLFEPEVPHPNDYWHKPIVVTDPQQKLGELLTKLQVDAEHHDDDVIDNDVILLWSEQDKRIITGSDLLGRMFRGIAPQKFAQSIPHAAPRNQTL